MFKVKVSDAITSKMSSMFRGRSTIAASRYQTHFKRLKNGLQLYVVSFPGIKTVSLRAFVFVGSVYENRENSGISHFLEHMLFRGNGKLGDATEMNVKMEELGGEFNAATSFDQTEYWLDIHRDYLLAGIERFCQFLQFPLFEQIEVERSIILEEINSDYNEENHLVDLDSLTSDLLWPGHPMGMPIIGNIDTIRNIGKRDLVAWHQKYYTPANMVLGITGDLDPQEIESLILKQFQSTPINNPQRYPPVMVKPGPGRQIRLVNDKDNQFGIQWTFPAYYLDRTRRIEYELLRRILDGGNSSRLQRLIREEKGLVYDISMDTTYFEEGAVISIQSVVGINRLGELLSSLVDLINDLIEKGVSQEELDFARRRFRAALECHTDTAQGILYDALVPILHPSGVRFDEMLPILDRLPLSAVNETLKTLLDQQLTTFAGVGPWTDKDRDLVFQTLQPWMSGKNSS